MTSGDVDPALLPLLEGCEKRIDYEFKDKNLLLWSLTHASGAQHRLASNERLEFLGDAILGAIVCDMLFHKYPEYLEGDLTRIKSVVVSRQTCAKMSKALGMQEFLCLGLRADVAENLVLVGQLFLQSGALGT